MKSISIHLGVLMTLLAIIYGLWQQYEYSYLIFKTIQVFFIWMIASYFFQLILRIIMPKPELEETNVEEPEEAQVEEK